MQNILFIPAIISLGVSALKAYKSIYSDKRKENIKIENTEDPLTKRLSWEKSCMETILDESELGYKIPLYYKINVTIVPKISEISAVNLIKKTIGVVVDYRYAPDQYDDLLRNGFYVHGRAGIFDEIDYEDENENNQIKPN